MSRRTTQTQTPAASTATTSRSGQATVSLAWFVNFTLSRRLGFTTVEQLNSGFSRVLALADEHREQCPTYPQFRAATKDLPKGYTLQAWLRDLEGR